MTRQVWEVTEVTRVTRALYVVAESQEDARVQAAFLLEDDSDAFITDAMRTDEDIRPRPDLDVEDHE